MVGQKGVWAETLRGMIEDPNGPQVDLRKEIILNLGQRVSMITAYKLPITTDSERLLFAIEVKNEAAVAKAIEKSLKSEAEGPSPTMKKRVIDGHVIWEVVEEEQQGVPSITLEVPALNPKKEKPKSSTPKEEQDDQDKEKEPHFLPHQSITVANGRLLIASHIDIIEKVLKPVPEADMLRNNAEFKKIWGVVDKKLGLPAECAREFSWTDEEMRPTYELMKQGKMPESQTLLARALNSFSGASKKGTPRKQRISGQNLPDYSVVRKSFGPAGLGVTSEPTGWFLKGFLEKR